MEKKKYSGKLLILISTISAVIAFSTLKTRAESTSQQPANESQKIAIKKDLKDTFTSYKRDTMVNAKSVGPVTMKDYRVLEVPQEIQVAWKNINKIQEYDSKKLWASLGNLSKSDLTIASCMKSAEDSLKTNKIYTNLQNENKEKSKKLKTIQAEITAAKVEYKVAEENLNAYKIEKLDKKLEGLRKDERKILDSIEQESDFKVTAFYITLESLSRYTDNEKNVAEAEAKNLIKNIKVQKFRIIPTPYTVETSPDALKEEVRAMLEGRAYFQAGQLAYYEKGKEKKTSFTELQNEKLRLDEQLVKLLAAEREINGVIDAALLKAVPLEKRNKIIAFLTGRAEDIILTANEKKAIEEYVKGERPQMLDDLIGSGVIKSYPSLLDQLKELRKVIRETKRERNGIIGDLRSTVEYADYLYTSCQGYKQVSTIYGELAKPLVAEERKRMNELKGKIDTMNKVPVSKREGEDQEELEKAVEEFRILEIRGSDKKRKTNEKLRDDYYSIYEERMATLGNMPPVAKASFSKTFSLQANVETTKAGEGTETATNYGVGGIGASYDITYGKKGLSLFSYFGLGKNTTYTTGASVRNGNLSYIYSASGDTNNHSLYYGANPYSGLQEKGALPITGYSMDDLLKPSFRLDFTKVRESEAIGTDIRWPIVLMPDELAIVPRLSASNTLKVASIKNNQLPAGSVTLGLLSRMTGEGSYEFGGGLVRDDSGKVGSRYYLTANNVTFQNLKGTYNVTLMVTDFGGGVTTMNAYFTIATFK